MSTRTSLPISMSVILAGARRGRRNVPRPPLGWDYPPAAAIFIGPPCLRLSHTVVGRIVFSPSSDTLTHRHNDGFFGLG